MAEEKSGERKKGVRTREVAQALSKRLTEKLRDEADRGPARGGGAGGKKVPALIETGNYLKKGYAGLQMGERPQRIQDWTTGIKN